MNLSSLIPLQPVNGRKLEDELMRSLEAIRQKLDDEISAKQITIERQQKEIENLWIVIEEKNKTIVEKSEKLSECMRNSEGNRQLINKLISDINRLNQDIEWYKKTYENRSLAGVLLDKLKHIISNKRKIA